MFCRENFAPVGRGYRRNETASYRRFWRERLVPSEEGETNLSRGERGGLSSGEEGSDASGENKGYAAGNGYTKGDSGADYRFGGTAFNGRDEGTDAFGDVGNDSVGSKKGGAAKASGESLFADEKLMRFGVDLTERARKGKLDPVIGREKEIEKLVQVLCRRSKNNPVLIGEPGVGKSAIAEGLAQLIAAGNVPEQLFNKKVFSVDLAGMLAGAKYRGEFEERLKDLMQAVTDDGDILLFIDEIHTLVGAGASSENTMDAANILKPLLARGEMQIVGATTIEEYRKYIEKDGALERRFTPVMVEEPSERRGDRYSERVAPALRKASRAAHFRRGDRGRRNAFHAVRNGQYTCRIRRLI